MAALKFQVAESRCTIWTTKLPRINYCYESHPFLQGISHLKFRLNCYSDNSEMLFDPYNRIQAEYFNLCLINCNQQKSNFKVNLSVYVENNDEHRKSCYFGTVTREGAFVKMSMRSLKNDYGINGDEISFLFIFDVDCVREQNLEKAGPMQPTALKSETLQIQSPCLQTFSEDIEKLFGNTDYSDAVLKCGDKSFPVNRNILSARSEVFAAMFRNKLKESETGVVDIPNVEPNVMEQFLLYLYSGRVEAPSMTTAFSLYQISDLYNVPSLKRKCASFLAGSLTEEVVCQVLQLAQQYENKELLDIATSFVTTKAKFIKSTTWKTFAKDYPEIGVEVYMKLLEN